MIPLARAFRKGFRKELSGAAHAIMNARFTQSSTTVLLTAQSTAPSDPRMLEAAGGACPADPTRFAVVCLLAGCFALLALHHRFDGEARDARCAAGAPADSPVAARTFDLRIEQRRLAGGASTLRVVQGDRIELRWTSDEVATLHLHGYEVEATVAPGAPATMVFEAYATGRFPIVAHGFGKSGGSTTTPQREKTLLYLEVHPR
ncbi:MAG: hypothetical protein E6H67_17810 [Betaproteobacteria bacterium]|nr:MAG: hypothetical protein E6H67_17810 [Betaproteobacteria bacterium]